MRIQHFEPARDVCLICNGLGIIGGELCDRCEGNGEEEVYVCTSCGEEEQNCSCFPAEDLPIWCTLDPGWETCPAPEGEVREAIEDLLSCCRSCPYAALQERPSSFLSPAPDFPEGSLPLSDEG